jgi:hypothetical protein
MKKVIKKVVAKAPVKKTVAKKPMMKSGGAKKPLRKAQYGNTGDFDVKPPATRGEAMENLSYYGDREGLVSNVEKRKKDAMQNKAFYDSSPATPGYKKGPFQDTDLERANAALKRRDNAEKYLRENDKANPIGRLKTKAVTPIQKKGGATKAAYKKGGAVKKVTAKKPMMKMGGAKKK